MQQDAEILTDKSYTRNGAASLFSSCVGMLVGAGVTILYASSVMVPAVLADTGWARASVTAALAPAALAIALMSIVVGALVDRFGPRRVLILGGVGYAISLAIIPLLSVSPMMFAVSLTIAAAFSAVTTPVTYSHLIIGWLPDRRGVSLGIALACSGLGVATVPALLAYFIPTMGWRAGYVFMGLAVAVLVIPTALFLVRDPPIKADTSSQKESESAGAGLLLKDAVRQPAFWTLSIAFLLNGLAATAGTISMPLVAEDSGIDPVIASTTMIWVGVSMIVSRIIVGALLDRFPPILLTCMIFAAPALGYAAMSAGFGFAGFIFAALLFGIAIGAEGDAMAVILSRRFGMIGFGKIFGLNFAAYAFCGGLGPWLLNALRTNLASDYHAFAVLGAMAFVGVAFLSTNRSKDLIYH